MEKSQIKKLFKNNTTYIINNLLINELASAAGVELRPNEIFVQLPNYYGYYISCYGDTIISIKRKKPHIIKAVIGTNNYYYFNIGQDNGRHRNVTAQQAVASVFSRNYWKAGTKLFAHHLDGDRSNNYYTNIIWLTESLHHAVHKIKKIVILKDGKIISVENIMALIDATGLKPDECIIPIDSEIKPLKTIGTYTCFSEKGKKFGFQYYKQKTKK
jgi:hypothetical protein